MYQKPNVLLSPLSFRDRRYQEAGLPGGGRNCLCETEIGVLKERELEVVILDDGHKPCCRVETLETNKRIGTTIDRAEFIGPTSARRKKEKRYIKVYGSRLYCFRALQIWERFEQALWVSSRYATYLFPTDSEIRRVLWHRRTRTWLLEDNWATV